MKSLVRSMYPDATSVTFAAECLAVVTCPDQTIAIVLPNAGLNVPPSDPNHAPLAAALAANDLAGLETEATRQLAIAFPRDPAIDLI